MSSSVDSEKAQDLVKNYPRNPPVLRPHLVAQESDGDLTLHPGEKCNTTEWISSDVRIRLGEFL